MFTSFFLLEVGNVTRFKTFDAGNSFIGFFQTTKVVVKAISILECSPEDALLYLKIIIQLLAKRTHTSVCGLSPFVVGNLHTSQDCL